MSKANFPEPAKSSAAAAADGPQTAGAWHRLATRLVRSGGDPAAARAARRGLLLEPAHPRLTALHALLCQRLGAVNAGWASAVRATRLAPGGTTGWRAAAALAYLRHDAAASARAGRRALLLAPDDPAATQNLFTAERERGRWEQAIAAGRHGRVLDPRGDPAAVQHGALLLALGRWEAGWPLYDRRLGGTAGRLPQPLWDGRPDPHLTLALWGDQNVGDEMQFAQLLPELATRVGRVLLECDPRLVPLFARSFPGVTVVARRQPPDPALLDPAVGAQLPLGHLGRLLRPDAAAFAAALATTLATGPRHWLVADAGRAADLQARYRGWAGGRKLIGVAWKSANPAFRGKNLPLAQWGKVLRGADALFLSVQYGAVAEDLAAARAATGVAVAHDPEIDPLADLDAAAAQLAALDLVISISNSTIHQACGLGRPVWGLLHVRPDWRWGMEGATCPWFPTLTLYRQAVRDDWRPVLDAVGRDLRRLLAGRPRP